MISFLFMKWIMIYVALILHVLNHWAFKKLVSMKSDVVSKGSLGSIASVYALWLPGYLLNERWWFPNYSIFSLISLLNSLVFSSCCFPGSPSCLFSWYVCYFNCYYWLSFFHLLPNLRVKWKNLEYNLAEMLYY